MAELWCSPSEMNAKKDEIKKDTKGVIKKLCEKKRREMYTEVKLRRK